MEIRLIMIKKCCFLSHSLKYMYNPHVIIFIIPVPRFCIQVYPGSLSLFLISASPLAV